MILFLNGTSSAGKTSIAKKIQELHPEPILHLGIDTFFFALHPRFVGEGDESYLGYQFIRADDSLGPKTLVQNGPYARKISYAMRRAFKAIVESQVHLIIDDLLFLEEDFLDYLELFEGVDVIFISVKPPLPVAESREKARGDRTYGLARGLYESVYQDRIFDLEIDTGKMSPEEAAQTILTFAETNPHPKAFKQAFTNSKKKSQDLSISSSAY